MRLFELLCIFLNIAPNQNQKKEIKTTKIQKYKITKQRLLIADRSIKNHVKERILKFLIPLNII